MGEKWEKRPCCHPPCRSATAAGGGSRSPGAAPTPALSPQAQPRDVAEASRDGNPSKALALFHHPVRLLWPRSKSFDYLYGVGERLLRNFPVQATLCLYDDSGSEEEEEEEEEDEEDNEEEDAEEDAEEGEGKTGGAVPATGAGSLLPAAGSARPV
ncbi:protein ripply1 [Cygnus olor]|uniref:protein ripply1 n=1 Tax=Cygnus olor TaxID=8869 RepID=UPI001ADE981A|nr:protein ripply1 [Cygnus olor]